MDLEGLDPSKELEPIASPDSQGSVTRGGGRRVRPNPGLRWTIRDRRIQVAVSIGSILILLVSSGGVARAGGGGGNGGLPSGIINATSPYYPFLVSPTLFPHPSVAVPYDHYTNNSLPQLVGTDIGTNPTYILAYDSQFDQLINEGHNHYVSVLEDHLTVQYGTYSPWQATNILTKSSKQTIPLNWSQPFWVSGIEARCTSLSLVAAPDGSVVVAGMSCGGTSYVYEASLANLLLPWTTVAFVNGTGLNLALDPEGTILATTFYQGQLSVTEIPFPSGRPWTENMGAASAASPVIVRTAEGALYGFVDVVGGAVIFYSASGVEEDFSSRTIMDPVQTSTSAVFQTVGDTNLGTPGGSANQLATAVVGQSIFALYTVLVNGTVEAAVSTSGTEGVFWNAPMTFPLTTGSIIDPQLVGTEDGYVYASWLGTAGGNLSTIDQTVFGPDGRMVTSPTVIPNGTGPWPSSAPQVVGVALDSFERPLFIWGSPLNGSGNELFETGAFLTPSNITVLENQALGNLSTNDFNVSKGVSTFSTGVAGLLSKAVANASKASTAKYLNAARNLTAEVYQNVSSNPLAYFGEIVSGSGSSKKYSISGGAVLTPAVKTGPGYAPPYPFGSLVDSLGFGSASTYLGVETDWLFSSEGIGPLALSNPLDNVTLPPSRWLVPNYDDSGYASDTVDGNTSTAVITPIVVNPTTAEFMITGSYPTYFLNTSSGSTTCNGQQIPTRIDHFIDTPTLFNLTPQINDYGMSTYTNSTFTHQFYVQNLSADSLIYWTFTLNAAYTETDTYWNYVGCSSNEHYVNDYYRVQDGPSNINMLTGASFSTTLTTTMGVTEVGKTEVQLEWTNSMKATGSSVLGPSIGKTGATGYYTHGWANYTGLNLHANDTYLASANTSSHPGGWNASWKPSESYGYQTSSPVQNASAICQFVYVTNNIEVWGLRTSNGANGSGTVYWWANADGLGAMQYSEIGTAVNQTTTAVMDTGSGNGTYEYKAEVHGLPGGAFYYITVTTTIAAGGCLSLANSISMTALLGQGFSVQPYAYAYDSITKAGGGEGIYAYLSPGLYSQMASQIVAFDNGSLTFGPSNLSGPNATTTITSLKNISCGADCYLENVNPATANATYVVQELLNFTWNRTVYPVESSPTRFTYLQDSSGDGLTDSEKVRGWEVTYRSISGNLVNEWETAAPSRFSTNGLVGDYVEKEFGLNPNVVDTADSGMLDTWNLTFNVNGDHLGAGPDLDFTIWDQPSYNPFASSVEYSPGLFESGSPASRNISNLTPSAHSGIYSGDGSPYASTVLWGGNAFNTFLGLSALNPDLRSGGQFFGLRAILGSWKGVQTLTVWGKLSWGANPLAASTIGGTYPDGERINPVSAEDLEIRGMDLYVKGLAGGQGYAASLNVTAGATGAGTPEFLNYSAPVGGSGDPSRLVNYVVAFPVSQTYQNQTIQLEVVANESGTSYLTPVPFTVSGGTLVDIEYNMLAGAPVSYTYAASNSQYNPNGSINFTIESVDVGQKATTWLWLPDSNSTESILPIGLNRYVGEQSFDLVVVNATSSLTSNPIPLPWGGTAYIRLNPGLNNILIPREQFLESPFGAGLLTGIRLAYPSSNPAPVILGDSNSSAATAESDISGFGGTQVNELEAYWQNRAISPTSHGGNFSSAETGTSNTSTSQIRVALVTAPPANNTGGLPSDPALLNSSNANAPTAAMQAVITLNITGVAPLDLLLSALITNTTDGSNGTFQLATNQVPFLGFEKPIVATLANATLTTDGIYGAPAGTAPAPTNPSSPFLNQFTNAVIGVVTNPIGTLVSVVGIVYTYSFAAYSYFNHPWKIQALINANLEARLAGALIWAGNELAAGLAALLQWVWKEIGALFSSAFAPIQASVTGYAVTLNSTTTVAEADEQSSQTGHKVSESHIGDWASAASGSVFQGGFGLGTVLAVILTIAAPFSIGPLLIASYIIPMIAGAALQSLEASIHLVGSIPSVSALTVALVTGLWGLMNVTIGNNNYLQAIFFSTLIQILAGMVAFGAALCSLLISLSDILWGGGAGAAGVLPGIICALAFVSILLDFFADSQGSANLGWLALIFGGAAAGLGIYAVVDAEEESFVGARGLDAIGAAVGAFGCLAGAAVVLDS
jgi:hypothetical protein